MVEFVFPALGADQHFGDARPATKEVGDFFDLRRVGDEDVRQLMVGERPGGAQLEVQQFAFPLVRNLQKTGIAQHAVRVGHVVDGHDRVFAGHQPQWTLGA